VKSREGMASLMSYNPSMILFYDIYVVLVQFQTPKHRSGALSDSVKV
jgi:hypothetical protein